jgi:FKBP-type peptidyl-prolyl cis-trans isomerase
MKNRLYRKRLNIVPGKKIEKNSKVHICYRIETPYGHLLYDSKEPELVELDRAMRGLKEGLIGMYEGEKCILFIHPEWTDLDLLSPPYFQSFSIASIEVVDAEVSDL